MGSQAEVDSFQGAFGGRDGCDTITGNLFIFSASGDIFDLSGLSSLAAVRGNVLIYDNPSLTNLDGLPNLRTIGGRFQLQLNPALENLDGLASLEEVGSDMVLGALAVPDLGGLSALREVGGALVIFSLPLVNLAGLEQLQALGGLDLSNNPALVSLDGLPPLAGMDRLDVSFNDSLTDLSALSSLTEIGSSLQISSNEQLASLDGLSTLTAVGRHIVIAANPVLDDCAALETLLDPVDDGEPGPGPGFAGIPDVGGDAVIAGNLPGCNLAGTLIAESCPRGAGYWARHPEAWPISLTLGTETYTQDELLDLLAAPVRGDVSLILARQLIATLLNLANNSEDLIRETFGRTFVLFRPSRVQQELDFAQLTLERFEDRLPLGIRPSEDSRLGLGVLANQLEHYNEGGLHDECITRDPRELGSLAGTVVPPTSKVLLIHRESIQPGSVRASELDENGYFGLLGLIPGEWDVFLFNDPTAPFTQVMIEAGKHLEKTFEIPVPPPICLVDPSPDATERYLVCSDPAEQGEMPTVPVPPSATLTFEALLGENPRNADEITSFEWWLADRPHGSSASLSDPTLPFVTLNPDVDGVYGVCMRITTEDGLSPYTCLRLRLGEEPRPFASICLVDPSPDAEEYYLACTEPFGNGEFPLVPTFTELILDGQESRDPGNPGGIASYDWRLASAPEGSGTGLFEPVPGVAVLDVDVAGDYIVCLVVTNDEGLSSPETCATLTAEEGLEPPEPPVANICLVDPAPDAREQYLECSFPAGTGLFPIVDPASTLQLDGQLSFDPDNPDGIVGYNWALARAPSGSSATLSDPTLPVVTLDVDVVGNYLVCLIVTDIDGLASLPTCAEISVREEGAGFLVELTWDTEDSDLDLHLLHPNGTWGDPVWHCYWANPFPNWGDPLSPFDDPQLAIDDVDGLGPELIALELAEEEIRYVVGVHYFGDLGGGPTQPTVRVIGLDGSLLFEWVGPVLSSPQFYEPLAITVIGGEPRFEVIDAVYPDIP